MTEYVWAPLLDRLATKFTVGDGCWEWTAGRSPRGYGRVRDERGRNALAHRVLYEIMVGPVPDGLDLDHLCRNRGCVRPDHLEPVTTQENTRRGAGNQNVPKTHCPQGHPYAGANLRVYRGKRHCRACEPIHKARYRAKRRA